MAGEYRIGRALGAGGFGTVYEAEHPVLKRRAAVKVLHENRSLDDVAVQRFIAEAQAASQIRHPNIVGIFSFGTLPNGRLFYVMDLLDGVALDAYLKEYGRLSPERALALVRPIASALDALHSAGVVHRDVKPANIFLAWESTGEVVPKLLDFGLIKLVGQSPIHTASDVLMGTPYYMAPEQCQGEAVDARSDVYSLGVICHELCTGQVPFSGDSASAVLLGHVLKPPPRMSEIVADLPPVLDTPVLAMLAKDREQRPASAAAAFQQLEQAAHAAGLTITTLELPRSQRPQAERAPTEEDLRESSRGHLSSLGPHERSASSKRDGRASVLPWGLLALGIAGGGILVIALGRGREPSPSIGAVSAAISVASTRAEAAEVPPPAAPAPSAAPARVPPASDGGAEVAPNNRPRTRVHPPRPSKRGTASGDLENPF